MKLNNQLTLQRLIGKIDNDFNISESDWIPRVAAWTIDALSQMKVLPMERKRRKLEVSDRIAQFPCTINAEELRVFDSNGVEIPAFDREIDRRRGKTLEGKDYCKYVFKSGSTLDNIAARESSRGKRRHGGLVEECVGVDDQILREVIIPTMAIPRSAMDGSKQPEETLSKSQVFVNFFGQKFTKICA